MQKGGKNNRLNTFQGCICVFLIKEGFHEQNLFHGRIIFKVAIFDFWSLVPFHFFASKKIWMPLRDFATFGEALQSFSGKPFYVFILCLTLYYFILVSIYHCLLRRLWIWGGKNYMTKEKPCIERLPLRYRSKVLKSKLLTTCWIDRLYVLWLNHVLGSNSYVFLVSLNQVNDHSYIRSVIRNTKQL